MISSKAVWSLLALGTVCSTLPAQISTADCALTLFVYEARSPSCALEKDGALALALLDTEHGPYTWTLNGGAPYHTDDADIDYRALAPGNYRVEVRDTRGCAARLDTELQVDEAASLDLEVALVNCDPPRYAVRLFGSQDLARLRLRWLDAPELINPQRRDDLSPGLYTLQALSAEGCKFERKVDLPNRRPLAARVTSRYETCRTGARADVELELLGGAAPYQVVWSDFGLGVQRRQLAQGSYQASVVDSFGCELDVRVVVDPPPALDFEVQVGDNFCPDEVEGYVHVFPQGGSPPYELLVDSSGWSRELLAYPLAPGDYELVLRDASGCTARRSVSVAQLSQLPSQHAIRLPDSVRFGATHQLHLPDSLLSGVSRSLWRSEQPAYIDCASCPTASWVPTESGTLSLMIEDTLGCRTETSYAYELHPGSSPIYLPSLFRLDEARDRELQLLPRAYNGTVIERFTLFDGQHAPIYETRRAEEQVLRPWDGTHHGQPCKPGVYTYEVDYRPEGSAVVRTVVGTLRIQR